MDIYIDIYGKRAVTSPSNSNPAPVPDFRSPGSYTVNLYFLSQRTVPGSYNYVRYATNALKLNLRTDAAPDFALFTVSYKGYETIPIDVNLPSESIKKLIEALPSIGPGNVVVTGSKDSGWTVEFAGAFAAQAVLLLIGRIVSSNPTAEMLIRDTTVAVTATGFQPTSSSLLKAPNPNTTQEIKIRQTPLATITSWTEIGVPSTPGWQGTLNTSSIPLSVWDRPAKDIILEVINAPVNRSGTDGVTVSDGYGRSGTGGQIMASVGIPGQTAKTSDNGSNSFLVAANSNGVYGRKFVPGDVGRTVTDTGAFIPAGTTILEVMDDRVTNSALLSNRFNTGFPATMTYTTGDLPSDVFYSATGAFSNNDLGHVLSGTGIAIGTRIKGIIDSTHIRMDAVGLVINSGIAWSIASEFSAVFSSATGAFAPADVGAKLRAPTVLPQTAIITSYIDATHVGLSVRPTSAATAVAWSIVPERAYPPVGIGHLALGTMTTFEVQQITLPQTPIDGYLLLQDGYGGNMPLVKLDVPVTFSVIKGALDAAYLNYGGVRVLETIPNAQWNITWGVLGQQRLLIVNDVNAIYEGSILSWAIANGSDMPSVFSIGPPSPPQTVPVFTFNGLKYIGAGGLNSAWTVGKPIFSRATDGTGAMLVTSRGLAFAGQYAPFPMNTAMGTFFGQVFYIIGDDTGEPRMGLTVRTFKGATIPADRIERIQQQRAMIGIARTFTGTLLIDMQLYSLSQSRGVDAYYHYGLGVGGLGAQPPDGPVGAIIHYINNQQSLVAYGGFQGLGVPTPGDTLPHGTFGMNFVLSWNRRRWMGEIWEQVQFYG